MHLRAPPGTTTEAEHHSCVECAAADALETERWLTLARKTQDSALPFPRASVCVSHILMCSFGSKFAVRATQRHDRISRPGRPQAAVNSICCRLQQFVRQLVSPHMRSSSKESRKPRTVGLLSILRAPITWMPIAKFLTVIIRRTNLMFPVR